MLNLPEVLEAPKSKPAKLTGAKWLAGEGAGSWFLIEPCPKNRSKFLMRRFSEKGNFECGGYFEASLNLDLSTDFELTYPSHCMKFSVIQKGAIINLSLIEKIHHESEKDCPPSE